MPTVPPLTSQPRDALLQGLLTVRLTPPGPRPFTQPAEQREGRQPFLVFAAGETLSRPTSEQGVQGCPSGTPPSVSPRASGGGLPAGPPPPRTASSGDADGRQTGLSALVATSPLASRKGRTGTLRGPGCAAQSNRSRGRLSESPPALSLPKPAFSAAGWGCDKF